MAFGNYPSAIAELSLAIISITCYITITKGYIVQGKLILIIAAIFSITINASKEGPNAGNQYLWFTALVSIFTLFSLKEYRMILLSLGLLLLSFIFVDATDFSFLSHKIHDPLWTRINHRIVMYFSFIACSFLLFFISKSIMQSFYDKDRDHDIITKQNKELFHAHNELDKFVYRASHDLRAPLTSMLGLIEVSKKEENFDKVRDLLSKQEETILKLDDYVKDILILSRIKSTEIQHVETNVKDLIENVLKQCQFMIQEKNMIVSVVCEGNKSFYSDPKRLSIILSNVISNSIKYADDYKSENKIEIKTNIVKDKLQISIRDNGIGIHKNELDKVVGMFYFNKNQNKGTGLGLYIVKETLNTLGGSLHITSKLKSFTQVYITIPIKD